ncbi:hypothetical protein N473_12890 [Pseudoalteromonas luteoviolacea CPMOR-1]|uniref:Uncharacterized protein n=1 Tax=Pseudoalteromonas luteoviolacea CPMOR-1 TaxID=1365248 RepID=A0A167LNQ9_9GAMM|nr:hypothetical protein N473_12890 [Pseudoalteromonas luteoviolacea CPMOR-1]
MLASLIGQGLQGFIARAIKRQLVSFTRKKTP